MQKYQRPDGLAVKSANLGRAKLSSDAQAAKQLNSDQDIRS